MELVHGETIQQRLNEVIPEYIAVAFVGIDWERFINRKNIKEIIVSPTIGSNPRAITNLVSILGWKKVFFLKKLHSKIYIGSQTKSALVGSFNLTANGLQAGITNLYEAGYFINEPDKIGELRQLFAEYKELSLVEFPDIHSKQQALHELYQQWGRKGLFDTEDGNVGDLLSYDLNAGENFYISWFMNEDIPLSEEVQRIKSSIDDYIGFADADANYLVENRWILCWKANNNGLPNMRANPYWLYIHKIINNGSTNPDYPILAIQFNENLPPPPFSLDNMEEIAKFKEILNAETYPSFSSTNEVIWSIANTENDFLNFMTSWQNAVRNVN